MQPEQDNWQQPLPSRNEYHPETSSVTSTSDSAPLPTGDQPMAVTGREGEDEAVRWQASEYIQREKSPLWYGLFGLMTIVLMVLAIFVVNSWTFAILVPIMAAALMVYSLRPPNTINYTLSRKGLHVNDTLYHFDDFKEFGLVHGDDEYSILMVPRKRFSPGVTIYFPEEAGEAIVDMLAARLPMHEIRLDPLDRLIRFLKI